MRRTIAAIVVAGTAFLPAAVANAQEESSPTTIVTEETTVERDITLTTTETRELEEEDDDSDKTGLWGLLGLLGLVGLAGLRKRHDDYTSPPTPRDTAPPGSSGATSTRP